MIRVTALLALLAPVIWISYLLTTGTTHVALADALGPLLAGLLFSSGCAWIGAVTNLPRRRR